MFKQNFLTDEQVEALAQEHGTPLYVYSRERLQEQARAVLGAPAFDGVTVRYAMKANPHPGVLQVLREEGVKIDASSGYEAAQAIAQGCSPEDILLTAQELAHNLDELVEQGVQFTATSLHQLEEFGKRFPAANVSVRINPGIGSGHSAKTNVGGVTSSFGIWHEYVPVVHELANRYHLNIVRLHTHIGAGTDPAVWHEAALTSLELAKQFPTASILDLGGGFKVARMDDEHGADMTTIGPAIAGELERFHQETGRKLRLELEPGTFLVANAGILLARVIDIVDTGPNGYRFLKLNVGMNNILRPALYGAQHPIAVIGKGATQAEEYVVVGHNCESGDLLTPAPGNPDVLATRQLSAAIGDLVLIGGAGAYCNSMATHGYNGFPSAKEVMVSSATPAQRTPRRTRPRRTVATG